MLKSCTPIEKLTYVTNYVGNAGISWKTYAFYRIPCVLRKIVKYENYHILSVAMMYND